MAPLHARGAVRIALATVSAACVSGSPAVLAGACDNVSAGRYHTTVANQGLTLLQTTPAHTSRVSELAVDTTEEQIEEPQAREAELVAEVAALQQKIADAEKKCSEPHGSSSRHGSLGSLGLCAVFGDPHFTTFDGAHTTMLQDQSLWLVKSQRVWVQALSHVEGFGNLMGLAVSGPFMLGHTLIFANTSGVGGTSKPFTVLFNDKPILDSWGSDGHAEFSYPKIMWAARREEWNFFLHDAGILEMDDAIDFDVGTWSSRFSGKPKGGVYLFKFPDGVELTVTGTDLMSAALRMAPQEGGQSGYCGNFNGDASDDFQAPAAGSIAENLRAAWGIPVGAGLSPMPEELDLFQTSAALSDLMPTLSPRSVAGAANGNAPGGVAGAALARPCPPELLAKAEEACGKVQESAFHAACLIDVCQSGDPSAADGALAMGILEGEA